MSVLQPLIDSGDARGARRGQTDFEQVAILRWDPATAQKRMEDLLTSTYASEKVQGVLSPYDGLSLGIIAALKSNGYGTAGQPCPVVTGQDAEVQSVKSILAGEQYSTIFKDTRELAKVTVDMIKADRRRRGARGQRHQDLRQRRQGRAVVPARPGDRDQGQRDQRCWSTPATTPRTRSSRNPSGRGPGTPGPHPSGRSASHGPRKSGCDGPAAFSRCATSPRSSRASRRSATSTWSSTAARSTRSAARTAPASRTLMKVLSGVYPHGTYEGEIVFEGNAGRVLQHPAERSGRHRDHPPGARADPRAVDRREHLPRQRDGLRRRHQLGRGQPPGDRAARPGRPAGEPADPGQAPRHRQAAAGRDRQGAVARRSSCSSSTSRPPRSTTTTPSTCSTCSRACRARASPRS